MQLAASSDFRHGPSKPVVPAYASRHRSACLRAHRLKTSVTESSSWSSRSQISILLPLCWLRYLQKLEAILQSQVHSRVTGIHPHQNNNLQSFLHYPLLGNGREGLMRVKLLKVPCLKSKEELRVSVHWNLF